MEKEKETKIMPLFEEITVNLGGWYCPRCETFHPRNMTCGPEGHFFNTKTQKWDHYGQKLYYWQ